jgi:serine/threonine protein kinase, bacterial
VEKRPFVSIVMELYPEGNLEDYLKRSGGGLSGPVAARLLEGIACGLEHLHANSVVHKDLKPANVLLRKDDEGDLHALLSDFGLSVDLSLSSHQSNFVGGTYAYQAPEQLNPYDKDEAPLKLTPMVDSYAFGMIAWQMATGKIPWEGETHMGLVQRVCSMGKRPTFPPARDDIWQRIEVLAGLCFEENPEDRPRAHVLFKALSKLQG